MGRHARGQTLLVEVAVQDLRRPARRRHLVSLYFEGDAESCMGSVVLSSYDPKKILKGKPEKLLGMIELAEESFEAFLYRIHIEGLA